MPGSFGLPIAHSPNVQNFSMKIPRINHRPDCIELLVTAGTEVLGTHCNFWVPTPLPLYCMCLLDSCVDFDCGRESRHRTIEGEKWLTKLISQCSQWNNNKKRRVVGTS